MSRATPDDQLKFLLSCIDFVEVAKECSVVSKGAAAKRYERLLKANGIHPSGGPTEKSLTPTPRQRSKVEIARSAAVKRRKIEGGEFDDKIEDEDDFRPFLKAEPSSLNLIKPEPDASFQSYSYQHMLPSSRPYFSRPPMLQVPLQNSYQSPFPPMHQQHLHYRPSPDAQRPPSLANPNTMRQFSTDPPTGPSQPPTFSQAPVSVSEDEIQSMFDEFCSQDLYKQPPCSPSFGTLVQPPAEAIDSTPIKNEPQSLTQSGQAFAETLSEPQQAPGLMLENIVISASNPITSQEPTGSGIENSILIMD